MFENVYHVILTVTRGCNLHCEYCFEQDKHLYAQEKMSLHCFLVFLDKLIHDRDRSSSIAPVEICFHGGEPTLVGIPLLQEFVDAARARLGDTVSFSLQTNGTLLDEVWFSFFQRNKISVSVSLDGYDKNANKLRFLTQQHTQRIRNYLKSKKENIGLVTLITKNNIDSMLGFLRHAFSQFNIHMVRANLAEYVSSLKTNDQEITGEELVTRFYIPLLRLLPFFPWLIEYHVITFLNDYVVTYLYDKKEDAANVTLLCGTKFCSAGNGMINLLPDGSVWSCQRSLGLAQCLVGNIYDKEIELFGLKSFYKTYQAAISMAKTIRVKRCDTCFAADICDHGCSAFALLKTKGQSNIREEITCSTYKSLKKYLAKKPYEHILLFALLSDKNIKLRYPLIHIEVASSVSSTGGRFTLGTLRDRNICFTILGGRTYVSFSLFRVNIIVLIMTMFWQVLRRRNNESYTNNRM